MSIAILLAEPDLQLAAEIKSKLESSSVASEVLTDPKNWVGQIKNKKYSHVILNYDLEKEVTEEILAKFEADHGHPKVYLVVSEAQRPFVNKSLLESASVTKVLDFPYTIEQVLKCIEESPALKSSAEQKFITLRTLSVKVIEEIYNNGLNEQNIIMAQKIGDSISTLIQKEKDFADIIKNMDDYKPLIYCHPFLVCVFSMMICRKLKWDSQRTMSSLALGALIHDIGMTALPLELRSMNPSEMNPEQFKLYQSHPIEGLNMTNKFPQIPSSVTQIILQHHEANSKGFPNAVSNVKIYPLAKVVSLSDKFARYLLDNEMSPFAGLKAFLGNRMEVLQHDPEMIKAMIKSFIKDDKDSKESA
jgi:HD-GYP domain-containing protein (c-di-GMP phosphodiesterase class II)